MAYPGTSGCRVICLSANWHDHGSRACLLAYSGIRYQWRASVTPPLSGNCDLRISSQGHDLQLPYLQVNWAWAGNCNPRDNARMLIVNAVLL
jgi:hypothetical protein